MKNKISYLVSLFVIISVMIFCSNKTEKKDKSQEQIQTNQDQTNQNKVIDEAKEKNPEDSSIEIFDGETAVINDPDGFTNIRYQPNTNSEILDKIIDGEEFQVIVDLSKDWWKVKTKKGIIGYVHKSRVRLFNEDKYNKPQTKKSFGGTFIDDTYKAQIVIDKFGKGTIEYSTSLFGGSIQQGIYTQSGNTLHFVFDSGRSNTVNISENESSYYFYIGETRYKKNK